MSYSLRRQDQDIDGDSPVIEHVNPAARPPGCFSAFTADYLQETDGEAILDEHCFVAFTLTCKCGNRSLVPAATPVDSNHQKVPLESAAMLLAPVVVSCPECGNSSIVFDPRVHGWDGQIGESASAIGDDDPSPCFSTGGLIQVDVSYQGEESYSNLAADGVQNLEDYFDTISISIRPDGSDEWQEVVSYECA